LPIYNFDGNTNLQISSTPISLTNQLPIKFDATIITTTLTRPNDTNTYAPNDVLAQTSSTPITFSGVGNSNAQRISIVGAMVTTSVKQTLLPQIALWVFKAIPSPIADNATLSISDAENDNVVTVIPFDEWRYGTLNARSDLNTINIPIQLATADTSLYAIPVIMNAYIPTAQEVFKFTLKIERQ